MLIFNIKLSCSSADHTPDRLILHIAVLSLNNSLACLSGEATSINVIVVGLIQQGLDNKQ